MKIVAIIFGGFSTEHRESIKAAKILYKNIKSLTKKYKFKYFYLTKTNKWASSKISKMMVRGKLSINSDYTNNFSLENCNDNRILELNNVDVIYNTMMGSCGENGNIMGIADLYKKPIIGCGILTSALCLDKNLSKKLVESSGIKVVDYLYVDKNDKISDIISEIRNTIQFPCFVKPNNLGTCAYIFKADDEKEFKIKFKKIIKNNQKSDKYLIEKYINNTEMRIFIYEDDNGEMHTDDNYVTKLNLSRIEKKDTNNTSLFNHVDNNFSLEIKDKVKDYAIKLFKLFNMKDYSRIDFFIEENTNEIYFNEVNTQPFIGGCNVEYMLKDGLKYDKFFDMMIKKNLGLTI